MSGYNVAFRYTQAAGGYAGIVTWSSFGSKQEFDDWRKNGGGEEEEVVEEGITQERAIELTRTTPLHSYVAAAIDESTNRDTGEVNDDLVRSRLQEVVLAHSLR